MLESLLSTVISRAARRPRLVLASAGILAIVGIAALPYLQIDTDVLRLLPRNGPATQAFKRYLTEFGSLDRVYVMFESPDERPIGDYAGPIAAYIDRVRRLPRSAGSTPGCSAAGVTGRTSPTASCSSSTSPRSPPRSHASGRTACARRSPRAARC